jgi:glycosyltransferase involved in cell wall biosynthesis
MNNLKVLWFTNTPSLSADILEDNNVGGGWIKSLESEFQKISTIKLGIAFYHSENLAPFKINDVDYFTIKNKHIGKLQKFYRNILARIEPDSDIVKFVKIIDDFQPDIIHVHGTENPFGEIIRLVDIPVVVSVQGNITVYEKKYFSGIEKKYSYIIDSVKSFILNKTFYTKYRRFKKMRVREQRILNNCEYVIGRTSWDKRISRILAPKSMYFHNDEVLRPAFYKNKWSPSGRTNIKVHVTTSGSFYKGLETILEAIYLIKNRLNMDIKCQIAGLDKDDMLIKIVRKKLDRYYPEENVVYLGKMKEDDLIKRMLDANIYVMPSHIENSPNSLCEAMVLGMPCIATHAGGASSLVNDGQNGIVIQDGDPWSMAGAIIELHSDIEKSTMYGINARKTALKRHYPTRIIKELVDIYSYIIKNKKFKLTN